MYYSLVLIVYILKFCYSRKEAGHRGIELNVDRRSDKHITVIRQSIFTADALVYTARNGFIGRVVDNYGHIWSNDSASLKFTKVTKFRDESKLLHIYLVFDDGNHKSRYYYRVGRVWNEISERLFYDQFDVIRSESAAIADITLYLNRANNAKRTRVNRPRDPRFAAYSPSFGYRINKVCDFNLWVMCFKSVWRSRNDEHCVFASVHKRDKPDLAYLVFNDNGDYYSKFYYKPSGIFSVWREIDRNKYLVKVRARDFDIDAFDNSVELDFENIDDQKFYASRMGYRLSNVSAYPRPGYLLSKVTHGNQLIWESKAPDNFCYYANMFMDNDMPSLCYLLVGEGSNRKVEYMSLSHGKWSPIDKSKFNDRLSKKDDSEYTYRNQEVDDLGNRIVETSYFKNKEGLMIKTYRAMVENHKGVILVTHGLRDHFLSTFAKFDHDWIFSNFGFATHPYIICPDVKLFFNFNKINASRLRHVFEYNFYDEADPLEVIPLFEYKGSMLESLNNMGYSVYGMDLQSHGFSESAQGKGCHAEHYKDYVYDLLQYIFIIKNDRFNDTDQIWNEEVLKRPTEFKDQFIMIGYSLGSNITLTAIQEYYRKFKPRQKLADGVVSLSGMLNLDPFLGNWFKRTFIRLIYVFSVIVPRKINTAQGYLDYGKSFYFSAFLNDFKYYPKRVTWRSVKSLFAACYHIVRNMKHYPKDLPTLFIHSTHDPICSVKGIKNILKVMEEDNVQFAEIPSNSHELYKTDAIHVVSNLFTNWVHKIKQHHKFKF